MVVTSPERQWLSVEAFRKRHGLGKNLNYDMVRQGRLLSVRLGGKILIASDALDLIAGSRADGNGQ